MNLRDGGHSSDLVQSLPNNPSTSTGNLANESLSQEGDQENESAIDLNAGW